MAKIGRPTKYLPEMNQIVLELASKGATRVEIAKQLGVCVNTLDEWKNSNSDLLGALKKGNEIADERVVRSLYQRATGYEQPAVKIFQRGWSKKLQPGTTEPEETEQSDDGIPSDALIVPYIERFPPDPTSMIFWLKNRRRDEWREKAELGITDKDGNDVMLTIGAKKVA